MSEVELTEQLDRAIEAVLRNAAVAENLDEDVAELAQIAAQLRDLPRTEFKARLRAELETEVMNMTKGSTQSAAKSARSKTPAGIQSVTPYVVVSDVHQEIDFIKKVFGAKGKVYGLGSQGGFHSEYRIGDSTLMIGGGGKGSKWKGTPVPVSLHAYVPDVDGVYQSALQAGATSLMPPADMEYGERGAAIEDVGGNQWYLATAMGPRHVPEGLPNLMPYFNPVGAPKMIEFLKDAFNAKEVAVHKSPSGSVLHAKITIGDSIVEMGEAHGQWQPRPMQFMVYVDDCDAAYERAMKAEGAISVSKPANAPYGGRTGTIKDPFGNTWYLSAQETKKHQ
jgi:PhnB protein